MSEYIPEAGTDPSGNICRCVCHSVYGVMHIIACCYTPLPELICSECSKELPKHRKNCKKKDKK